MSFTPNPFYLYAAIGSILVTIIMIYEVVSAVRSKTIDYSKLMAEDFFVSVFRCTISMLLWPWIVPYYIIYNCYYKKL